MACSLVLCRGPPFSVVPAICAGVVVCGNIRGLVNSDQLTLRYFGTNPSRLSTVRQKCDLGPAMFSGLVFDGLAACKPGVAAQTYHAQLDGIIVPVKRHGLI